jgi:hypothetical protein
MYFTQNNSHFLENETTLQNLALQVFHLQQTIQSFVSGIASVCVCVCVCVCLSISPTRQ